MGTTDKLAEITCVLFKERYEERDRDTVETVAGEGAHGKNIVVLGLETDLSGTSRLVESSNDYGVTGMTDEELVKTYEGMESGHLLERMFDGEKEEAYNKKQRLANRYHAIKRQETEQLIGELGIGEILPYLYGDLPCVEGEEVEDWNRKRTEAWEKAAELEARGIDMAPIEEFFYYQSGQELLSETKEEAEKDGFGSSLFSFLTKGIGGITGGLYQAGSYVAGKPIDSQSAWYMPGRIAEVTRKEVSDNITESTVEILGRGGTGEKAGNLAGSTAGAAYRTVMGIGDFAVASTLGNAGTVLIGAESYAEAGREAAERGLGADSIQTAGLSAAAGDMVLDKLLMGNGKGAASWGKSGVTMAGSGNLNRTVDRLSAGDLSLEEQMFHYYLQQGMTEEEAREQLRKDNLKQTGAEFAAGAVMGAVFDVGQNLLHGKKHGQPADVEGIPIESEILSELNMLSESEVLPKSEVLPGVGVLDEVKLKETEVQAGKQDSPEPEVQKPGLGKLEEVGRKTIDTGDLKVIKTKAPELANSEWLINGYDKPPYHPDFEVKVVEAGNEEYVRVFSYNADGTSNKLGGWLMKKSDIEGLTPTQIANKYALPKEPTHICDVKVSPDFNLQTGIANSIEGWGNGGGQQFDTMGKFIDEDAFVNERLIGE